MWFFPVVPAWVDRLVLVFLVVVVISFFVGIIRFQKLKPHERLQNLLENPDLTDEKRAKFTAELAQLLSDLEQEKTRLQKLLENPDITYEERTQHTTKLAELISDLGKNKMTGSNLLNEGSVNQTLAKSQSPPSVQNVVDDLAKLKALLDNEALTQEEFEHQKKKLLGLD